jgi:site-specific recombinase XerD
MKIFSGYLRPSGHMRCSAPVNGWPTRAAHIDDLTPHVLRHCFGKNLIDAEVSLEKVAALLGHSNLNTTRIYITPSEQDLEKAVETIAR